MKVNEKIQYYRKKAGLSQEELGKRLLVSRQTVSLWETGQTLPTLDNLTRLREIFGVSIDELLLEGEEELFDIRDESSNEPYESYNYTYSKEDIKKINRSVFVPNFTFFCFFFVFLIASIIKLTPEPTFEQGIVVGATFVMSLLTLVTSIGVIRTFRTTKEIRLKTEYTLDVFEDRFVFDKRMDGSLYERKTVFFREIKNTTKNKDFISIYVGSEIYNFRRDIISRNSLLYSVKDSVKARDNKPVEDCKRIKKVARVFFVLSLLSILFFPIFIAIAMFSSVLVAWIVSAIIILISVMSILSGIVLRVKGGGGIKSIIFGVISLILILVISFLLIGTGMYSPVEDAEYYIGIDVPEKYSGMNLGVVEEFFDDAYVYYRAEYYFEDKDVLEFESGLKDDSRWITSAEATELLSLCPENSRYQGAEYFIFYEFTTERLNHLPTNDEYVSYILVAYFVDENMMIISEYDCNN